MKKYSILIAFLLSQITSAQCAMCKAVVENGDVSMAEGVKQWYYLSDGFPLFINSYFILCNL